MNPNPGPEFSTCDLCDTHKNDDDGAFRLLPPVFRDFGAVTLKTAATLPPRAPEAG